METIINENIGKTNENICDRSSTVKEGVSSYSSFQSLSFPSSNRSEKQQRSISDPRKSLQAFSSRINPSKNFHRRSTVVCVPLSDQKNDLNEIILRVPYKDIEEKYFQKFNSHHSIALIKENSSYPIDQPNEDENQYSYQKGLTRIKLSLSSHYQKPLIENGEGKRNLSGEFLLPTNPPITVTIESERNLNNIIEKDNCYHDDQICSPENVEINEKQRISIDPSLKGTSTIVNYLMDLLKPSDNKLAMKLFGSRKGVLKERLRQQRAGNCIIHPCSNFRFGLFFSFFF
jgi:hypothetical protein